MYATGVGLQIWSLRILLRLPRATVDAVAVRVRQNAVKHPQRNGTNADPDLDVLTPAHIGYAAYRAHGGYELAKACVNGAKPQIKKEKGTSAAGLTAVRIFLMTDRILNVCA